MKTVTCIRIKEDGDLVLQDISLCEDFVGLEIPMEIFDCQLCGKKSSGRCSQGPEFVKEDYAFILYYEDPHSGEKNARCTLPINIHSNIMLAVGCSRGYQEYYHDYRGSMYLRKFDT